MHKGQLVWPVGGVVEHNEALWHFKGLISMRKYEK